MTTWTLALLCIAPIFVSAGVLYSWLFYLKNSNDKFPFNDAVPRNPGESLNGKISDLSFDIATYLLLSAIIPVFCYALFLQIAADSQQAPSGSIAGTIFVLAAIATGWSFLKLSRTVQVFRQYRTGLAGELAVGGALNQLMLQGYRVFHDIQCDKRFNIDHILVGPAGVFAVETKTKRKKKKIKGKQPHIVVYDGKSLHFPDKPNNPHNDFLQQAKRNASWVSKWLSAATGQSVKVQPVLVMPGWFIENKKFGDVRVLNHNQLQSLTRVMNKTLLGVPDIERIAYQIQQRSRNDKIVPSPLTG